MLSRRRAPRKKRASKKENQKKEVSFLFFFLQNIFLLLKWDQCVSLVAKKKSIFLNFLFPFIDE